MSINKIAENSRMEREYRRLTTNINVPPVDENLQVRSLRNRNIPYDTRPIDKLNSKTKNLDTPPRCNSLTKTTK